MKYIILTLILCILSFMIGKYIDVLEYNQQSAIEHFESRLENIDRILMGFGMSELNSDISLKQLITIYFDRNTEARRIMSYEIHNLCIKYTNMSDANDS